MRTGDKGRVKTAKYRFALRYKLPGASPMVSSIKNLPAMWESQVLSLGLEELLEEGMAIHSSILAWRNLEEPGRLQSMESQRVGHN